MRRDLRTYTYCMKKLRCLLGFHNWKTFVSEGESYLKCPDCGKYGGEPGSRYYRYRSFL